MKPDDILDDSPGAVPPLSTAEALWELEIAKRKIRVARSLLILLGSLYIAYYITTYLLSTEGSWEPVLEALAVGTFFIVSGLLTKRYPAGTLSIALLLYLVYQIVLATFYGMDGLLSGIIWKVIIFSVLIVGIRGGVQFRKLSDQLET